MGTCSCCATGTAAARPVVATVSTLVGRLAAKRPAMAVPQSCTRFVSTKPSMKADTSTMLLSSTRPSRSSRSCSRCAPGSKPVTLARSAGVRQAGGSQYHSGRSSAAICAVSICSARSVLMENMLPLAQETSLRQKPRSTATWPLFGSTNAMHVSNMTARWPLPGRDVSASCSMKRPADSSLSMMRKRAFTALRREPKGSMSTQFTAATAGRPVVRASASALAIATCSRSAVGRTPSMRQQAGSKLSSVSTPQFSKLPRSISFCAMGPAVTHASPKGYSGSRSRMSKARPHVARSAGASFW
mmetsp:Transcript_35/g.126  ORF Transcript_35/g.126 Transcript_35/m.126 type:complete len:301 (-) Transcript_35:679-1581(-)